MTITNEQISVFINSAIISSIIYMIIYSIKGKEKNLMGYINALGNCFSLSIVSIFIIVGAYFIKVCITQPLYVGLIVPIGWYFIAYFIIKNILNNDFGLNIHIIKPASTFSKIFENMKSILPLLVFAIACGIATFASFREIGFNLENGKKNIPILLIVGCIFLCTTIAFIIAIYCKIKEITIGELFKISKEKLEKIGSNLFFGIFILCGILALVFGTRMNNDYREKEKIYEKTQGIYINYKVYSEADYDSSATYSFEYVYEVDGKTYTVWTNYGTSLFPKAGSKKIILYNPQNPSEAIIEGNFEGNFAIWFGVAFIIIPTLVIFFEKIEGIKNSKIKRTLNLIGNILINIVIIAFGVAVYILICSNGNDYSIITAFKKAGLWSLVPIAMIAAGIINISYFIYQGLKKYIKNKK